MTVLTFILRRAAHQWTRLLTLSLGVLLATTLLAASPALTATIVDYSLRRDLENREPLAANLRITSRFDLTDQSFSEIDAAQRGVINARLNDYANTSISGGTLLPLTPWRAGRLISEDRFHMRFYDSADGLRRQVEFVDGVWPDKWGVSADYVPVLITPALADAYQLAVGSELPLSSSSDFETPSLTVTVVGIIQPLNGQDDYWFGTFSPFSPSIDDRFNAEYSLLMPPDALIEVGRIFFPERDIALHWNVLLATNNLTQADISPLAQTVRQWQEDARSEPNLNIFSELPDTLDRFLATTGFVRSPLLFIILIVALLALFYIVLVNALSLAQTQGEFAVLISRGANRQQITRWQGIETLGLIILAMLLGPLLAWGGLQLISRIGPLGAVGSANWGTSFPRLVWPAALLGALAAAVSSFLPLPATLRSSVVTHLQRRVRQQETAPWWQRYYADVMLLIVGAVLISRLPLYGSFLGDTQSEGVDWLLLLAPAFILFGTATLFLRVFPPLLQLAARAASRFPGLSLVLVLWQVARQPRHVSRLLLLLTITTALGLFSTSLDSTLSRNEEARARFVALGAQRLEIPGLQRDAISAADGTLLWRSSGALGASIGEGSGRFDLLAVDPTTFNQVADYRADFADRPVGELLNELDPQQSDILRSPPFIELPGQPRGLELYFWLRDENLVTVPGFSFEAKLVSPTDEVRTIKLLPAGEPDENGWTRFAAEIPALPADQYPLSLQSMWMRSVNEVFIFPEASPAIDQISVLNGDGTRELITSFEIDDQQGWKSIGNSIQLGIQTRAEKEIPDGVEDVIEIDKQLPYDGDRVLGLFLFYQPLAVGFPYGFHTRADASAEPLPALVTPNFIAASGAEIGDEVTARISSGSSSRTPITIKIVGIVNYFPTMEGAETGGSVITLRDPLLRYLNAVNLRVVTPNEVALSEPSADLTLLNGATANWEFEQIQAALKATPLVLGLRTVTIFGYVLSAMLSLAGFATYFFMNSQQLSGSYAILRALGMSVRQLYTTLLIEQSILVISGLGLGTALGLLLSRTTLQNLAFRTGDIVALPPFELIVDWATIARVIATLIVAFAITLSLIALSLWRTDIHRTLRVGEE